ncbi:hypothetical protein [Duncaniella muricolitica]|nr:hypothetical protein [Duncaniella muricolitica]
MNVKKRISRQADAFSHSYGVPLRADYRQQTGTPVFSRQAERASRRRERQ